MIDIHCHILPRIDDGPSDIKESIEMARIAALDGISKVVATPHIKNTIYPAAIIKEGVEELNNRLRELGIPVEIIQGADVNALLEPSLLKDYTINGTDYILLEFPHGHLPKNAKGVLFRMITKGYRPIITHPERNRSIVKNPELLFELLDTGSSIQITAESITGAFGPDVQECAGYLVKRGVVSFMATDAHSRHQRRPVLSEGLRVAEKIIGQESASKLVTLNPEAVITGKPLDD